MRTAATGNRLLATCMISLLCMCCMKNLLFIMTDQEFFDALGYAGNTELLRPNLDRLAMQGIIPGAYLLTLSIRP
jgi:hypothetical protein